MNYPVLFFVDIVFILYFLLNIFVDFREIDDIIIHYRKILILKGVYGFPDAVLVCQEVSFFEIYMFFYDILKRYQNLLLDLKGDKEDISLDVIYDRLVVCHQSEVFVPGRFHHLYRRLMIRKLCEFSCEWMEKIYQMFIGVSLDGLYVQIWYLEHPFEDEVFGGRRIEVG